MNTLMTRRTAFTAAAALATAAGTRFGLAGPFQTSELPPPGERPLPPPEGIRVLNPRNRVPLSFIIDDSTCLVNLAHYAIPQFAEVFPDRYRQDWRKLPREIPDDFVRKFGEWCGEHGIRGKYSIVPFPACVGRLDQRLPGWSRFELERSLQLVRELMMPSWDIHPEMVTHTFVIDPKTGHPLTERSARTMENWDWSVGRSPDELTEYLTYALTILKNAGLQCEGVTTPGGFGNRARPALSQATLKSCREVFGIEIPHYFRDLYTDDRSVSPLVQRAAGLTSDSPQCVVSILGCTGDWFGGWDGLEQGSVDQFITADLNGGRLPQVIDKQEPAILVCHWPGIWYNGEEYGFRVFQEVVRRVHQRNDNLIWMKLSEIARYWAARELTAIRQQDSRMILEAPWACPEFTLHWDTDGGAPEQLTPDGRRLPLAEVGSDLQLTSGSWCRQASGLRVCLPLQKGRNEISVRRG